MKGSLGTQPIRPKMNTKSNLMRSCIKPNVDLMLLSHIFSTSQIHSFSAMLISVVLALQKHELKSDEIHADHIVLEDKDGLKIDKMEMIHQWKSCNWFAIHLKGDIFRMNVKIVAEVS